MADNQNNFNYGQGGQPQPNQYNSGQFQDYPNNQDQDAQYNQAPPQQPVQPEPAPEYYQGETNAYNNNYNQEPIQENQPQQNTFQPGYQQQEFYNQPQQNQYSQSENDMNADMPSYSEQSPQMMPDIKPPNQESPVQSRMEDSSQPEQFQQNQQPEIANKTVNEPEPSIDSSLDNDYNHPRVVEFPNQIRSEQQTAQSQANFKSNEPYMENGNSIKKEKGGKAFFIISTILILILGGLAGGLYYVNFMQDDDSSEEIAQNDDNTQSEQEKDSEDGSVDGDISKPEVSKTGGVGTPATLARVYNVTEIPSDWMIQKFTVPDIEMTTGLCSESSVCSPEADPDNDGLTNIDEYNFQTDPNNPDSDDDGIDDGDELFVYYSDPNNVDSDGDGVNDGEELVACTNVVKAGSNYIESDLSVIKANISLYPIHEVTQATLTAAEALTSDLSNGYIEAVCSANEGEDSSDADETDSEEDGDDSESGDNTSGEDTTEDDTDQASG